VYYDLSAVSTSSLSLVLLGGFVAGFTTGFAGFGSALVASGLWFHALPAVMVPPLVVISSVAAHILSLATVRRAFAWRQAAPFLVFGCIGIPFGVLALRAVSPNGLRFAVGAFLIFYALFQLAGGMRLRFPWTMPKAADAAVALVGGALGGFAGLSGPLPLIWLQLKGLRPEAQRAIYQPFNFVVLAVACIVMAIAGQIDRPTLLIAAACMPATLLGAFIGARIYIAISEQAFQRVVLFLLATSGLILVLQH